MSGAVPDVRERYRGRRRRFRSRFTRKAGGAAVPALLVAASIVVLLIVVGVSELVPGQAAGHAPIGSTPSTVANEYNPSAAPDMSDQPITSVSSEPVKSASPTPSAKGRPSASPSRTRTVVGAPTPIQSRPTFGQLDLEAESATLAGGARVAVCTACSGAKVRYIGGNAGTVTFDGINAPSATNVQVSIAYLCGTAPARTFYISVNGGAPVTITLPLTPSWDTPGTGTINLSLRSGPNSIKFYNPALAAPDLDRISIRGR
jgi:hypothetical protein